MSSTGQAQEWPRAGLDVGALVATGWRPVPFQEFILKVHSRCNLACDYCYVYESTDQSWRAQPRRMSAETISRAAEQVARHAQVHGLEQVEIVLHGGEPLLAGIALIDFTVRAFRAVIPSTCRVGFTMQTNGLLLTEQVLEALGEHDIGIAVSLDGDSVSHDRHRQYANGRGSHAAVMRGLALLAGPYHRLYRGLLCTVDLANDPLRSYAALLEAAPPRIDFLLPYGSWSAPPGRPAGAGSDTAYADWLITVFDRWYRAPVRETGIRYFEEIINLLFGGQSRSENIGLSPVAMIVVETDGTLQQVDTLKTSYAGAPETGLTVLDGDLDEALRHPGVVSRQIGLSALCETCLGCPVRDVCGGGGYVHRYRAGHGYRNPSVYCRDLRKLISHISLTIRQDLAELAARAG